MIQYFWLLDFVGMFLARLTVAFGLLGQSFVFYRQAQRLTGAFHFLSACFIFVGLYSSFLSIIWILYLIPKLWKDKLKEKKSFLSNSAYLYLLAFFFFLLFVGPGKLSFDRILQLRY